MPIRPENKAKYPTDWPEIRARILVRADSRCEWCGVKNYAVGTRNARGEFQAIAHENHTHREAREFIVSIDPNDEWHYVIIVLTIAHVHDMNPENCADDNLAALCQRCHNRHDRKHRGTTAAQTRESKEAAAGQTFIEMPGSVVQA